MPRDKREADAGAVVTGLSATEAESSAARYFGAIRWEPPAIDPEHLTVSVFFGMVLEQEELAPNEQVAVEPPSPDPGPL